MTDVVTWSATELRNRLDDVLAIFAEAMGITPQLVHERRPVLVHHLGRPGFRAVAAVDGPDCLGFGYGYTGAAGQWWYDRVRAALPDEAHEQWLRESFEICELHVSPPWQGRGFGRRLLRTLLGGVPRATALLSTEDLESPARHLYRSLGFVDLLTQFTFAGDPRRFAIMGARLPLGTEELG